MKPLTYDVTFDLGNGIKCDEPGRGCWDMVTAI